MNIITYDIVFHRFTVNIAVRIHSHAYYKLFLYFIILLLYNISPNLMHQETSILIIRLPY